MSVDAVPTPRELELLCSLSRASMTGAELRRACPGVPPGTIATALCAFDERGWVGDSRMAVKRGRALELTPLGFDALRAAARHYGTMATEAANASLRGLHV